MSHELIPPDYQAFLQTIKSHIQQAQLQAVLAVNRELILLYWQIGRSILERQQQQGWGAKVVDALANDLHAAFPQMKGFSVRNLKYMRAFALAYPNESFVQQVAAQIPWGQHCLLLDKVKDDYALADIRKPVGIATYQFTTSLPEALKDQLPAVDQLEAGLKNIADEEDH